MGRQPAASRRSSNRKTAVEEAPQGAAPQGILDPTGRPASDGVITLKMSDLEAMLTRVASIAASAGGGPMAKDNLALAIAAMENLKGEVARNRIHSNSISDYHGKSVFAPDGKAEKRDHKLRYKNVFFLGDQLREESLTPLEIDKLNEITEDKDARDGAWTAVLTRESGKPVLTINAPYGTMDARKMLPSLLEMCEELLNGKDTLNPHSLMSRLHDAEQKIQQLQATLKAA